MLSSLEKPRLINPSKRQKRRERLSPRERRKFIRMSGDVCEITGEAPGKGERLEIHHKLMVSVGGRKTYHNLVSTICKHHRKIHSVARQIAKSCDIEYSEITRQLSEDAEQLGKWGRVENGEDPAKVYKKDLYIEHVRSQQDMFEG